MAFFTRFPVMRQCLSLAARFGLAAACLAYALWGVDFHRLGRALAGFPVWAMLLYAATVLAGALASRLLAAQLYAGQHDMECSLPATIRSRSYQGVEEEIITLSDLEDGKFGIREVDWFLNAEMQASRDSTLATSLQIWSI